MNVNGVFTGVPAESVNLTVNEPAPPPEQRRSMSDVEVLPSKASTAAMGGQWPAFRVPGGRTPHIPQWPGETR